jgi:membrane protein implicated in regulation of membrane protease activity
MDGRRRRSIKEGFDLGIGFAGFFAAAFFVITVVYEVLRMEAVGWAITTVVFAALAGIFWLARREMLRRIDAETVEIDED